jgi:diaminohydroxyphosphoribosylaminopyrimidine deaminase/5-amino-6-(5-phosphoribosylamino)uracil reductase
VIKAGITRVVVAHEDPDARVAGAGLESLRDAGIEVVTGVLAAEARRLNAAYLHQRSTNRPYVTLKLALSLDGRMAAADGSSRWITGESSRRRVHQRRLETDVVMIGAGTALQDDPSLTVREVPAARQPLRVVLDSGGRTPALAQVFGADGPCLIATTDKAPHETQMAYKEKGAEVMVLPEGPGGVSVPALLEALGRREILEIYCEGGAGLATSLLEQDLVDRLELYFGPLLLGAGGPALGDLGVGNINDAARWSLIEQQRLGDDTGLVFEKRGD